MSETPTLPQEFDSSGQDEKDPFIGMASTRARQLDTTDDATFEQTTPTQRKGLTAKQTLGLATASAFLAGGIVGGVGVSVVESAVNHSEPTIEQLNEQALSSILISPSPINGDLLSSAEEGFEILSQQIGIWNPETKSHDPYPLNISHDRIVTESNEAQEEYLKISGAAVVPAGAQFKMYLLQKDDGTFDIEINSQRNNER